MYRIVMSNPFVIVFTAGAILTFLIEHFLEFIDFRSRVKNGGVLPAELKSIPESNVFDTEKLSKIVEYENSKYFAWIPKSFVFLALNLVMVLSGLYPWIFNVVCRITSTPNGFKSTYFCAVLFMILISIPESIISIPFELYKEFKIEKKFGFSNMTFKLWLSDQIKEMLVGIILTLILGAGIIGVLCVFPSNWWIFVTSLMFAFTLIMQIVYPLVIAPLFNKFVPLEDGELKSKITLLMEKLGFKSTGIFIVDASKRSGHSNAYFTGLGKSKRVVLYDTLVKQLTTDELVAVLGHEFGHYKLHHITRKICILLPCEFLIMYLLHYISQLNSLYTGFGFAVSPDNIINLQFIGLFLSSIVFSNVQELFKPVFNLSSQKDEYAADAFSKKLTGNPDALISGLIKLNSENLHELLPPKLYVIWNYSHPTLISRIKALKTDSKN